MGNTPQKPLQQPEVGSHIPDAGVDIMEALPENEVELFNNAAVAPHAPDTALEKDLFRKALEQKRAQQHHETAQPTNAEDELAQRELITQQKLEQTRLGIEAEKKQNGIKSTTTFQPIVSPGIEGGPSHSNLLELLALELQKQIALRTSWEALFQNKIQQMKGGAGVAVDHRRTQEIQGSIQQKEKTAGDQSHGGG